MSRPEVIGVVALYLPVALALLAGFLTPPQPRRFAGCLLGLLWTLATLLLVQRANLAAGWWSFAPERAAWLGLPLTLYTGWAILWGLVPQLAFARLPLPAAAAIMVAADLAGMPLLSPVLHLGPHWLAGEAFAAAIVLVPALSLARWTHTATHLNLRATLQLVLFGLFFLYFIPEITFALHPGRGWSPLLQLSPLARQLTLLGVTVLALPGVAGVVEFATRGGGTPIPYDPPLRLVRSGIYRYLANPMQTSCLLVMVGWAAVLRSPALLIPAALSVVYSAGIARWDERQDLDQRFGSPWRQYRAEVRNWLPRLLPFHASSRDRLYIAETCGPCSEIHAWLLARQPVGLRILAAEHHPSGPLNRMRYDPADGTPPVEGVRALARALEHLHLGWALAGAALRLPGVWQTVQLVMDAAGFGPRELGQAGETQNRYPNGVPHDHSAEGKSYRGVYLFDPARKT